VILHWPTKFYANRMIADGVIPSPLVQQLTKYGLSCNKKYIINLGCIIS